MNERIRLLAEQAFTITTDGKIGHVNNYMVEKFAELIVRECADKCLEMAYVNPEPHHYAAMIKEHFGVEQ